MNRQTFSDTRMRHSRIPNRILLAAVALCFAIATTPAFATNEMGETAEASETQAIGETPTETATLAPGEITRAILTTEIVDREPIDELESLANDHARIFFFTELRGLEGQQVTHRWEFNEEVMASVPFQVAGDRWRVWSSKSLQPIWLGEWRVSVISADGVILDTRTFVYEKTDAAPASPAPADPSSE